MVLPKISKENSGKSISVTPFYMDEFLITNQQYVEFLNNNLSRINVENGVIKGDGANWILLGEVYEGYEPIVYRNEEFHVSNPTYASSPVLRVTGYGASAFAKFFGRRLPTVGELLYAAVKGTKDSQSRSESISNRSNQMKMDNMMHEMMGDWRKEKWNMDQYDRAENSFVHSVKRTSKEPPPALFYDQNVFGIRGLNQGIGEWAKRTFSRPFKAKPQGNMFAVIGGLESQIKGSSSIPSVISRLPWEGFEEVGFRTVLSPSIKNQR
jgi:serine/threonine-protein kinase